jgi:hypothetical protein
MGTGTLSCPDAGPVQDISIPDLEDERYTRYHEDLLTGKGDQKLVKIYGDIDVAFKHVKTVSMFSIESAIANDITKTVWDAEADGCFDPKWIKDAFAGKLGAKLNNKAKLAKVAAAIEPYKDEPIWEAYENALEALEDNKKKRKTVGDECEDECEDDDEVDEDEAGRRAPPGKAKRAASEAKRVAPAAKVKRVAFVAKAKPAKATSDECLDEDDSLIHNGYEGIDLFDNGGALIDNGGGLFDNGGALFDNGSGLFDNLLGGLGTGGGHLQLNQVLRRVGGRPLPAPRANFHRTPPVRTFTAPLSPTPNPHRRSCRWAWEPCA